jgi:DNA gyrase subunit B
MYVGDTAAGGLHQLVFEVVDNSIDEAMAGHATRVSVTVHVDESVTVVDDGRGIPVGKHPDPKMKGKDALEVVMTTLHAGGKFDHDSYKMSAGLHGVGVSCVNALSEWLTAEVKREGQIYTQRYERGKPVRGVVKSGKADATSTRIVFKPDPEIFEVTEFDHATLAARLRELAFLNAGLTIKLTDERHGKSDAFRFQGGLAEFVKHLNHGKSVLHARPIYFNREREITTERGKPETIAVECAIQYNEGYDERVRCYANNIHTVGGGTHLMGFRKALTATINRHAKKLDLLKKLKEPLTGDDFREGLTAIVSIRLTNPQFESQTKFKLGNTEIAGQVETITNEALSGFLEENPPVARKIILKAVLAAQARAAARKQRDLVRKSALEGGGLPGKLADCSERQREGTEIYLVEGDSAGGSAKAGRDRHFQAILPLRGKILNVEQASREKLLSNEEIKAMIVALGAGFGEEDFDIEKLKYDKIIIMTDADVDGAHIRTLLLTFFYRRMPRLIDRGHVYIAQPPLYGIRKGKRIQYMRTEEEKDNHILNLGSNAVEVSFTAQGKKKPSTLTRAQLRQLLDWLLDLERTGRGLLRKGTDLQGHLKRARDGQLPQFHIVAEGVDKLCYALEELEQEVEAIRARFGREDNGDGANGDTTNGDVERSEALYDVVEFPESKRIASLLGKIRRLGIDPGTFGDDLEAVEPPCVITAQEGEKVHTVTSLAGLLATVREIGGRGVTVQRYKGLGEMNPTQLWETTMDPKTRTLLRVSVEDGEKADEIFVTLMGTDVESRREFITTNALNVQNLDV